MALKHSLIRVQRGPAISPERVRPVDDVQGSMAKGGLAVQAPRWLLCVAVPWRIADTRRVAISLHQNAHFSGPERG